jgi:hypothetical protein
LGLTICERVACGETLSGVCRDRDMPSRSTVYRWQEADSTFRDTYRRAREMQMQSWGDEIVEIADDTTLDTVTKMTPQGREYEAVDHENIQRSKLRVNTRQWLMARLNPALYGDKVEHEHSGMVGHAHIVGQLDDKEKVRRLATFLLQSGQSMDDAMPAIDESSTTASAPIEQPVPDDL